MNRTQTFKNQDIFSFVFADEEFANPNQFKIGLKTDYKAIAEKMLAEDTNHTLKPEEYAAMQLNVDIGINFFYFAFIKVFSYQKRREFLDYQFEQCKHKMTFLYRLETLPSYNYWYAFGENSYYNPDTEKEVMDWVLEKYKGVDTKPKFKIEK